MISLGDLQGTPHGWGLLPWLAPGPGYAAHHLAHPVVNIRFGVGCGQREA